MPRRSENGKRSRSPSSSETQPPLQHHTVVVGRRSASASPSDAGRPSRVYSTKASPLMLPKKGGCAMSSPGLPPATAAGPSRLACSAFTEPEIEFHVEAYRRSNNVTPRDVANLMLWGLPTTLPLVESPKWLFIKNRSHVGGVLTIYCNGLSYDAIMNTGANVALPATSQVSSNEGIAAASTPQATAVAEAVPAHWNDALCAAALQPIRRACCFARGNTVCHTPIWVPSQNNRFELDLFLRSESGQRTNSAGERSGGPGRSMLDLARAVASGATNTADVEPPPAAEPPSGPSDSDAASPLGDANALPPPPPSQFLDTALLKQFALRMESNEDVLRQLQFTLVPPPDEVPQWSSCRAPDASEALSGEGTATPHVYAFDCEMVLVSNNVSALARCTLIEIPSETVVLDILVKPSEPVVDYVTRYSGITEEMLSTVTTTLGDAQAALRHYLHSDAFVVGHSLENDFKACKLVPNCFVLDTSHLFPHPAGSPYKNALRYLALTYLKRRIQNGEHDSAEDALVCAHLVALKLKHGPAFGLSSRINILQLIPPHVCNDPPSAPAVSAPAAATTVHHATNTPKDVAHRPIHISLVDDPGALRMLASSQPHCDLIKANDDDSATKKVVKLLQRVQREVPNKDLRPVFMVWTQLRDCEVDVFSHEASAMERVRAMNARVMSMVEAAPDDTLVNVIAANCREGNGNRLSKAHGVLFTFFKEGKCRGPVADGAAGGCAQS